jgi:hypothetical protein
MPIRSPAPRTRSASVCLVATLMVALAGCDLTAPPAVPTTLVVSPGAVEFDALEATLPLSILVRDQAGATLGVTQASWLSEDETIVSVTANGTLRAVGEGVTRVRARLGDADGWASVEVRQRAADAEVISGEDQVARAGSPLPAPIRFRILDRLGNPWADRDVTFELPLGGSVSPDRARTDSSGSVEVRWTLGPEPGLQSLTVRAGDRSVHLLASATDANGVVPFRIRLRTLGTLSPPVQAAMESAATRWEGMIAGKLSPILVRVPSGRCGENALALDEVVDDLLVIVSEEDIDGSGGTAAFASPCFIRQDGLLPIVGRVVVDRADVDTLIGLGLLDDVLAHELGHVLGFGTLWGLLDLVREPSLPDRPGVDTHFTGPRSALAFDLVGGSSWAGPPVPLENEIGGLGSRDVHWRQGVFFNELMTPLLVPGQLNPLSRVTVASMADLGYEVREDAADPYVLPGALGTDGPPGVHGAAPYRIRHLNRSMPLHVLDGEGRIVHSRPGSP